MARRYTLRGIALGYLLLVLLGPLSMVFWRVYAEGVGKAWTAITDPDTIHAFRMTLLVTAIAVPLNTVFGIVCGLAIAFFSQLTHSKGEWAGQPIQLEPFAGNRYRWSATGE